MAAYRRSVPRAIRRAVGPRPGPTASPFRGCAAPSTGRIIEIFADITRHQLRRDGQLVQTFEPELSPLHQQVLQLLDIPTTSYTSA